jgi:hypothetical protein
MTTAMINPGNRFKLCLFIVCKVVDGTLKFASHNRLQISIDPKKQRRIIVSKRRIFVSNEVDFYLKKADKIKIDIEYQYVETNEGGIICVFTFAP